MYKHDKKVTRQERMNRFNDLYPQPETVDEKVRQHLALRGGIPQQVRAMYQADIEEE